jgi:hypothetical protein
MMKDKKVKKTFYLSPTLIQSLSILHENPRDFVSRAVEEEALRVIKTADDRIKNKGKNVVRLQYRLFAGENESEG